MKAYIAGISKYLPKSKLTNEELAQEYPEWSVEKIFSKTGISTRHISAKDETVSDMATLASEALFQQYDIKKTDIDFILLCTQSPDYLLPTTACLVQKKLGLSTQCGALDFNLGCSGYVYGLSLAKGLVETGQAKNVLLITSEQYSKYIAEGDKSVRTLFGDGAAATWISGKKSNKQLLGPFLFGTDGGGAENLIVPHGGGRFPITKESEVQYSDNSGNKRAPKNLYMNGGEIFNFTLKSVPSSVEQILLKAEMLKDELDYIVFHQANKFMLDQLRRMCGFDKDKFLTSYQNYGNTVSSTIPLGLADALDTGKFKCGDKILIVGFGVGYSWAGTIITWQ